MVLLSFSILKSYLERIASDAYHTVGDDDGREAGAAFERRGSDALHRILHTLEGNYFGDNYISRIGIVLVILVRHFGSLALNQIIVDAINHGIIGECFCAHHAEEQG